MLRHRRDRATAVELAGPMSQGLGFVRLLPAFSAVITASRQFYRQASVRTVISLYYVSTSTAAHIRLQASSPGPDVSSLAERGSSRILPYGTGAGIPELSLRRTIHTCGTTRVNLLEDLYSN